MFYLWNLKTQQISNGPDKKERTKRNEHIGMQKSANFTVFSTTLVFW